ncbi:MAG: DUF2804 domain-containing protein [Microbacterium sp.]
MRTDRARVADVAQRAAQLRGDGLTENVFLVDGSLHEIHGELTGECGIARWGEPWRIADGGLDATFTPLSVRSRRTRVLCVL